MPKSENRNLGHPQNSAFSLRAFEMGGSGSSEGTPSAPQPMSNVCQSFPIISYGNFFQGEGSEEA